jgi:formylglycine-generating enzyme required for sulfatase activity
MVDGYEGVYDLTGNVWEFEDSCDGATGNKDWCASRGGSFYLWNPSKPTGTLCKWGPRNLRDHDGSGLIGFRCCSDS